MRTKYFLVFVVSLGLLSTTNGQNDSLPSDSTKQHSLSLSLGSAYNLKLDHTYSLLARKGFNNMFSLSHFRETESSVLRTELGLMAGTLKDNGSGTNLLTSYSSRFLLSHMSKIKKCSSENLNLFTGLGVGFRGTFWFPDSSVLRYGWDINTGIVSSTLLDFSLSEDLKLRYELDVHLLGILWRSNNNGQRLTTEEIQKEQGLVAAAFQISELSHPFNALYWDNRATLFYSISEKWDIYASLGLYHKNISFPLQKRGWETLTLVGIKWNLGK